MDDLISRQAAIDAMMAVNDSICEQQAIDALCELPSAEPEPWEYDEDCGCVMCRCPKCSGRMTISLYQYKNPYKFCPYCGQALTEGKLAQTRKRVYGKE